ncbi:MAG: tetratricopeptide repeat-containing protein [Geminicoccaceae bacterium]
MALRAFIVRPFGTKNDKQGQPIDFDRVERELIAPALEAVELEGRTTGEIAAAGNIREDMFRMLIASDVVIADISIHNANVFYELGIRHAVRPWRTFLLRCRADEGVFDLQTDRYLQYERDHPAACLPALIEGLRQSLAAERRDSPVYLLLPQLEPPPRAALLPVPQEFGEAVERAQAENRAGDLELLAAEARGFEWESQGLRVVGRAQFKLGAHNGAIVTWEAVREVDGGDDLEANTLLGTSYQKIGELVGSDQAVQRALKNAKAEGHARAELLALVGRNAKTRWQKEWMASAADAVGTALRSSWLDQSAQAYGAGFAEDRNHFYPGLNALAMLTVETELAVRLPAVWAERFDDDQTAQRELETRRADLAKLATGVRLSLDSAKQRQERAGEADEWIPLSETDLRLLTIDRPQAVAGSYQRALANASEFAVGSARQQLELYRALGVRGANVEAALAVFPPATPQPTPGPRPRVVLFTGHMIDAPGRKEPRFPAEKETVARDAIRTALQAELAMPGGVSRAIAGGASGGDLLFLEACAEFGIAADLYLALPPDQFVAASVAPAGPGWIERFRWACERLPKRVLAQSKELQGWLQGKADYDIWQRNNLWMLHNALALGRDKVTLIALWDGEKGDGPGGTEHMVDKAKARGA